jgi:hypothetical protein
MVSLASKSVLSEYWCCERGEHSSGKLRVRGVRIRGVPGKVVILRAARVNYETHKYHVTSKWRDATEALYHNKYHLSSIFIRHRCCG